MPDVALIANVAFEASNRVNPDPPLFKTFTDRIMQLKVSAFVMTSIPIRDKVFSGALHLLYPNPNQ